MKRGDIGPISDDIPSIFPIVFGVLLFMGTALYTTQRLDDRNQYLELRKAAVGLSYVALADGYMSDSQFEAACVAQYQDYAERRHVSFMVSLKKFCRYVSLEQSVADVFSPTTAYPGESCPAGGVWCTGRVCPNPVPRIKNPVTGVTDRVSAANPPPNFQILNFPVAVQCNEDGTIRGPGVVNIIIWK